MDISNNYEKIADIIMNWEKNEEIVFNNWIDIRELLDIIVKKLIDCKVKQMNWSNFTINYNNSDYIIERFVNFDNSCKYLIIKND